MNDIQLAALRFNTHYYYRDYKQPNCSALDSLAQSIEQPAKLSINKHFAVGKTHVLLTVFSA